MITLTFFQVSTLITAAVSLFLGIFVYWNGEKTKLNFSWLITSVFISLWSIGLFGVVVSSSTTTAWFWQYILDIGGICVPVAYFNFLLYLEKKDKKLLTFRVLSIAAGVALIILNFTNLFKTGVSPKFGLNFWIDPGKLYFLFPFYFASLVVVSFFFVLKEYRSATDINQKRRLMYILMAQVFGFGGGLTDFFPQLFHIYPFGNYFVIIYVIFISYAALKHHLFDVRVLATELLTFAICITLLTKVLFSIGLQDLIINSIIFLAVILFSILLLRSIINEVKQKEQIEKMAEDVKRAYEKEKKANEELEKLDKYKNDFLRQAQHDLRRPLTMISWYSDLLLGKSYCKLPKKAAEIITRMQSVTKDKIKDINNFLDLEQFRMGKGVVSLKPGIDLSPILEEITMVLSPTAQLKGIYLKSEKLKEVTVVNADREKLKAAIFNVVDNAIKYTPKGGVNIKIENSGTIKIIISDTGIGIPQDKIKALFGAQFERLKQAEKTATGSGVGLYLSAQIIKLHHGKIWAESEGEGKGSTFYIELPTKGEIL